MATIKGIATMSFYVEVQGENSSLYSNIPLESWYTYDIKF